jgi:glucose/arabinose dehydrogenase
MSFDNRGRLWVAVMPSYPHWRPGDPRPNDKLLILEDTDGDGKADKQTVFADGLHLPIGFEFAPEGVYVAQEPNLVPARR